MGFFLFYLGFRVGDGVEASAAAAWSLKFDFQRIHSVSFGEMEVERLGAALAMSLSSHAKNLSIVFSAQYKHPLNRHSSACHHTHWVLQCQVSQTNFDHYSPKTASFNPIGFGFQVGQSTCHPRYLQPLRIYGLVGGYPEPYKP